MEKAWRSFRVLQVASHHIPDGVLRAQLDQARRFAKHRQRIVKRLIGKRREPRVEQLFGVLEQTLIASDIALAETSNFR